MRGRVDVANRGGGPGMGVGLTAGLAAVGRGWRCSLDLRGAQRGDRKFARGKTGRRAAPVRSRADARPPADVFDAAYNDLTRSVVRSTTAIRKPNQPRFERRSVPTGRIRRHTEDVRGGARAGVRVRHQGNAHGLHTVARARMLRERYPPRGSPTSSTPVAPPEDFRLLRTTWPARSSTGCSVQTTRDSRCTGRRIPSTAARRCSARKSTGTPQAPAASATGAYVTRWRCTPGRGRRELRARGRRRTS